MSLHSSPNLSPAPLSPEDAKLAERALLRERLLAGAPSEKKMREEVIHTLATLQYQMEMQFVRSRSPYDTRSEDLAKARVAYRVATEVVQMKSVDLQNAWLKYVQHFEG